MDYRDNRQRWAESHQVVHFYAGQWCTFTPALTLYRRQMRSPAMSLIELVSPHRVRRGGALGSDALRERNLLVADDSPMPVEAVAC